MKQLLIPALFILAGCASQPSESDYCRSVGVDPGHPEYANCTAYYFQQEAAFAADRAVCDRQADATYPKTLYSRPTSFPVRSYGPRFGFGAGPFGYSHGGFAHTEMVHVGADYQQIAEVDRLRMSIIQPCMQTRGWQSGATWQAGRIVSARAVPITPLPWRK